jgi:hypothetical protein
LGQDSNSSSNDNNVKQQSPQPVRSMKNSSRRVSSLEGKKSVRITVAVYVPKKGGNNNNNNNKGIETSTE